MEETVNVAPEGAAVEKPFASEVPSSTPEDKMISVREAARQLSSWRIEKRKEAAAQAAQAPAQESSPPQGEDTAAPEEPPSETTEVDAAPELPPVEPPRSWSKEDKDWFASLPHEQAERIAERERSRELDLNRRQQEAAEKQKVLDATLRAAEQRQRQYEEALPILLQNLQQSHGNEFPDIQTMADVQRMAAEDPIRYTQWDAAQKKVFAVQQEYEAAQQRQQQEHAKGWQDFASREDALFAEAVPEIADTVKGAQLREQAIKVLTDIGFSNEELTKSWNGEEKISIRDHRFQRLVVDAAKYRTAQKAIKAAPPKAVPPVTQRPGVSRGTNAVLEDKLKALDNKLNSSGSLKDAAALYRTRMKVR